MKKFVVECTGFNKSQMEKARNAVEKMSGVKSVHPADKKLTVIGTVNSSDVLTVIGTVSPSDVLSKLKRIGKKKGHGRPQIVSEENYEEEIEARNRKWKKIFKKLSNGVKFLGSVLTCVAAGIAISGAA